MKAKITSILRGTGNLSKEQRCEPHAPTTGEKRGKILCGGGA